ncbi:hypothetical protein [Bacteroides oleiciplenus]|uniref:hypothetical protein n=1 Tax=Bacteroides oleiciplenus TaxID=626931 RepID=UPI0026DA7E41|nr:hypothetical protein [Bacteroides oleiciplenus]
MEKEQLKPAAVPGELEMVEPERIIDNRLYEQLQNLMRVKLECGILFAKYSQQGVGVGSDETTLYEDLNSCMRTLAALASNKYEFDLKKGSVL